MRQDPRVPFAAEVRVRCQSWDQFAVVAAQNLSRGGIFLRTDTPAPLHSRVQVILTDPNGSEFQISGRIAHVVSPDRAVVENREPGIGVQFEPAEPRIAEAILMLVRLHAPAHLSGLGRKPSMAPARPPGTAPATAPATAPRNTLAGMLAATEAPQSRPSTPERRTLPVGSGESGIRPVELGSTMLFESAREPDAEDAQPSVRREARSTLRGAAPPAPSAPVTEGRRTTLFGFAATGLADASPEGADLLSQTLRGAEIPAARAAEEVPIEAADDEVPIEVDDVPIEVEAPADHAAEPATFVPAGAEPPTVVPPGEPPTVVPRGEPPTFVPTGDEPATGVAVALPHKSTLVGIASPLAPPADEPPTTVWARTAAAPAAEEPAVEELAADELALEEATVEEPAALDEVEIEADEPETAPAAAPAQPATIAEGPQVPATRAVERALPMERREALRAALRRELRRVWTGTPHEILGAAPGEALASLRQRLVQRARRYHPNAHLRAAPDVHRLLREITTRLVAAYATIAREERLQRHMTGAPAARTVRVSLPPDPLDRYSDITLAAPPAPPHEEVARTVEAGRSALSERRFDEARHLFEAALALDPDDAAARGGRELVLGFFALAAHNEARAQDHFEAALALDESFDEAALQVRRLHQRRRDGARNPRRLGI